ncbi:helix-turn-helix domain-containing protein [Paenibacillus sp. J5C_2022]|nr:helix-turn-helix domain-containing protein [Paenibacillus sp. J5C2022]
MSDAHGNPQRNPMLYHLSDIHHIYRSGPIALPDLRLRYALVACTEGEGTIKLADECFSLQAGDCFLLPPQSSKEWTVLEEAVMRFTIAAFDVFAVGPARSIEAASHNNADVPPCFTLLTTPYRLRLLQLIHQLNSPGHTVHPWHHLQLNITLQQALLLLLRQCVQECDDSLICCNDRAKQYIHEHYHEPITVEMLAEITGLSCRKFSEAFQEAEGMKPLHYINKVRLEHARKLLLHTDRTLKEIASAVGFHDEYYFNRRFKEHMGMPPKIYARIYRPRYRQKDGIVPKPYPIPSPHGDSSARVVVTGTLLGEVLALGCKPAGAELTIIGDQVVYQDLMGGIQDVGILGEADRIAALSPDLILLGYPYHPAYRKLAASAPTAIIDCYLPPEDRLRYVAVALGAEKQAADWLRRNEESVMAMWASIHANGQTLGTASVLLLQQGSLYMMGSVGLAATIYHEYGFLPPPAMSEQLIQPRLPYMEIAAEQLPALAGDTIFLLAATDAATKQQFYRLQRLPLWNKLEAVRSGKVHRLVSGWNFDDPITRQRLLILLPALLRSQSTHAQ